MSAMWGLKFTVRNTDSIYTVLSQKYKVIDYMYPVDHYRKGNKIYIVAVHVLEGDEQEKRKFALALKKHRKTKRCEHNGAHLVTLIAEEEPFYALLFAAELYHPTPVVINGGYEHWRVGSWNRALLENLISELEKWKNKFPEFTLHSLSKVDLSDIYFPKIFPQLPEKQKLAFRLALRHGYYTWPRKADLGVLARQAGVSVSTFQEHLRKAEAKLLPFFAENIHL